MKLSAKRGKQVALQIARATVAMKGAGGGRIYVNEFGLCSAPLTEDDTLRYVSSVRSILIHGFRTRSKRFLRRFERKVS